MTSLDDFAGRKLAELEHKRLRRSLAEITRETPPFVGRGGHPLLSFSCNDYLSLTSHPVVKAAAFAALSQYGAGAGASRLVTGNHPLYRELEERLAQLKGMKAACVFGSGYLANSGIIPVLAGPEDLILIDALSHACLWAGAKLSHAKILIFDHNDVSHVKALLAAHRAQYRHALLVTEGVFSMDGDLAPLAELAELCEAHEAWLMSDDAHGLGVLGDGCGSAHAAGVSLRVPLQMGTLSKAVGSYGGYLCASEPVIDLMKTRARTLIYSTALPPATVGAAIAALQIIQQEPALTRQPLAKARLFTAELRLPEAQSPIVPLIVGDARAALVASEQLEKEGFLVTPIRPPTVPVGTARLRFAFTAAHADEEILRLAEAVRRLILQRDEKKGNAVLRPYSAKNL